MTTTDWVTVRNLRLRGYHGVLPEEGRLGQEFQFDIDVALDTSLCAAEDDYSKSVCYGALCDLAREVSQRQPYKLLETLANRLAEEILTLHLLVDRAIVKVRKPSAPIDAQFDWVGVTVERQRERRIGLSLGSNLGDKAAALQTALAHLHAEPGVRIEAVSSFYRTAPWGDEDQDWFLNAAATAWTTRKPEDLLKALKRIELALGRKPARRWGPRAIDIDLLFADDLVLDTPTLTLPHPEMFNRAFVLVPLAEIAAETVVQGRSIGEETAALSYDPEEIVRVEE